jgi:hypothetical protein
MEGLFHNAWVLSWVAVNRIAGWGHIFWTSALLLAGSLVLFRNTFPGVECPPSSCLHSHGYLGRQEELGHAQDGHHRSLSMRSLLISSFLWFPPVRCSRDTQSSYMAAQTQVKRKFQPCAKS